MWRCCGVLLLAVLPAQSFQAAYFSLSLQQSAFCNRNFEARADPAIAHRLVHKQLAVLQMASTGALKQKATAETAAATDAAGLLKAGNQAAEPDKGVFTACTLLKLL
jgi:hypothetical protein